MARSRHHDILFEPVKIGPLTAKNRFYQVPHCSGLGNVHPSAHAAMRGVKAEGGWAVVCPEECGIHPSGDIIPAIELRLWDDRDIPAVARITDAIHAHGSLAGVELNHSGPETPNLYSRESIIGPSDQVISISPPAQARAMDKEDIRNLRRWHRHAARRARTAGFDIVYVYAGKFLSILTYFLSSRYNHRTDEYGGSLENRSRLLKELLEGAKEEVGDTCGIVCRISMDELIGPAGIHKEEAEEMIVLLDHLPDMWDLTLSGWQNDSQTSRFSSEAFQEPYVLDVKKLSNKPVVGVGRFTSPDTMARQVRQGILDMIGAARPSIADPFLPKKIEEGRLDDIRECIGCNICVASEYQAAPIICTQNPTMGEEWRRNWHPERIRPSESETTVLVVGSGPSGLECAQALGKRGYDVKLSEAATELGGRVTRESRLPGLSEWIRVRDYRVQQLNKLVNVEVFLDSRLSANDVLDFGFEHIVVATGSRWNKNGTGRATPLPAPVDGNAQVLTPDDIMDGATISGHVIVYDDDHYYIGGVVAELLASQGCRVSLVTPAAVASSWTVNTMEQHRIQRKLMEMGVAIVPHRILAEIKTGSILTACAYTERPEELACDAVVLVTSRGPENVLWRDLKQRETDWQAAGIQSVTVIGDALAPGTIAAATFAGRRYAEELDGPDTGDGVPFKREITELAEWP
ncbi:MAG: NAD(P)-binding protein [Rhodospirillales bacterium]|nr:NAD(P)-binding protein [Rhodospirillales bacterium]